MTKKKNIMRPLLTHARKSIEMLWPRTVMVRKDCQRSSYDDWSTFTQTSAATAAASRIAALPVSLLRYRRRAVSRRHHVVAASGAVTSAARFACGREQLADEWTFGIGVVVDVRPLTTAGEVT